MTLLQANLHKIRDKSALCAKKLSLKILLKVNLRLRACFAMCLKYERSQPKRAYKARAYKKEEVYVKLNQESQEITRDYRCNNRNT